jgi:hypothetical protein
MACLIALLDAFGHCSIGIVQEDHGGILGTQHATTKPMGDREDERAMTASLHALLQLMPKPFLHQSLAHSRTAMVICLDGELEAYDETRERKIKKDIAELLQKEMSGVSVRICRPRETSDERPIVSACVRQKDHRCSVSIKVSKQGWATYSRFPSGETANLVADEGVAVDVADVVRECYWPSRIHPSSVEVVWKDGGSERTGGVEGTPIILLCLLPSPASQILEQLARLRDPALVGLGVRCCKVAGVRVLRSDAGRNMQQPDEFNDEPGAATASGVSRGAKEDDVICLDARADMEARVASLHAAERLAASSNAIGRYEEDMMEKLQLRELDRKEAQRERAELTAAKEKRSMAIASASKQREHDELLSSERRLVRAQKLAAAKSKAQAKAAAAKKESEDRAGRLATIQARRLAKEKKLRDEGSQSLAAARRRAQLVAQQVLEGNRQAEGETGSKEQLAILNDLRGILLREMRRVIDTFRDMDANHDGKVSMVEFRRVLPIVGARWPEKSFSVDDVDALFHKIDRDKSGSIEYTELNSVLRQGLGVALAVKLKVGGAGEMSEWDRWGRRQRTSPGANCMDVSTARG